MKQKLLTIKSLLVAVLLGVGVNGAWAEEITATWKAASGTATAANTVLLNNEAIKATTYFATTKISESKTISGSSFTHYIQVRNAAYPTTEVPQGTEYSGSTSIELDVTYGGTITLYYMRQSTAQTDNKGTYASNDGKDLKVYKQSDASVLAGTLTIDSESADGTNGWATKVVTLEAGTKYTLSAKGTTIRFYGFSYTYDDGWTVGWSRTFDDTYGITEFTGSVETQNRSNSDATQVAGVFVGSGSKAIGYSFPTSTFEASTTYEFTFDFAMSKLNNTSSSRSDFTITDTDGTQMFKLKSAGASGNEKILVYIGASTDELSKDKTEGEYTANCLYASGASGGSGSNYKPKASNWYTIKVSADDVNGTWVTFTPQFTQDGYTTISKKISDDVVYVGSLSSTIGQHYGCLWLDNLKLKQIIAAGFVADPEYAITAPDGTNRKFTLSCSTEGATIYWATSELAKGAAGWTAYASSAVSTAATTIYAYAKKDDNTSNIINFSTGAGTAVDLLAATVTHTAADKYTITNNQSSLLGSPTATVHYQIDGGAEQTSISTSVVIPISADGTLTYWLTATGYSSTSPVNEAVYAEVAYAKETTIDFCTNTNTSSAKWAYGDTNDGTPYASYSVTTDDTDHSYYKYLDESGNIVGDGLLAVSAQNGASSWRVQKSQGGTAPYNKTEYVAVLDLKAGQIVQIKCNSTPGIVSSNISAIPASTYTGTYTYMVNTNGDAIVSLAKGNTLKYIYLCSTSVSKTITAAGWATYYSPYALNLAGANANLVDAFIVEDGNGTTLSKTSVKNGTVPAYTGLLLKGTEGAVTIPVVASSSTDVSANKLEGVTVATEKAQNTVWVLMGSGDNGLGFYKNANETAFTVGANTAYLPVGFDSGAAPTLFYSLFDNETTGVNEVRSKMADVRGEFYNLAGQRVAQPTKGLYIVNGKKVVK